MAGSEYTIAPPPPVEQEQYTIVPPASTQATAPKPAADAIPLEVDQNPQSIIQTGPATPSTEPARERGITREGITGGKDWLLDALTAPGTFLGKMFQPFKEPSKEEKYLEHVSGQPSVGNLPLIDPSVGMEPGFAKGLVQGMGGLTAPNQLPLAAFSPESKAVSGLFAAMTIPQLTTKAAQYQQLKEQGKDAEANAALGEMVTVGALGTLATYHAAGGGERLSSLSKDEQSYLMDTLKNHYTKSIGEELKSEPTKFSEVPPSAAESEGLLTRQQPSPLDKGPEAPITQESREQAIRDDTGTTGREGSTPADTIERTIESGDRGEASQRELIKTAAELYKHETGKELNAELLNGSGREDPGSAYNTVKYPILGKGRYSTPDHELAAFFGPNIQKVAVNLNNPLVISSDAQWRTLTTEAGWEFPNPLRFAPADQPKAIAEINNMRQLLESKGYDGVVITPDHPRNANSDNAKTLGKVFGGDTVVEFHPEIERTEQERAGREATQRELGSEPIDEMERRLRGVPVTEDNISQLQVLLPEFNKIIGGGEGAEAHPSRGETASPYPASEDEPPPPVISRVVDDDLAASGINVVHRGRDINVVSRFLGSFNETARKLEAEGHPLGPVLKQMAGIMSDVTKNIAANQTDTLKAFINGAQKLVSRDEWSNQVVNLMDRRVDERPAGTPDHVWNAYQVGRNLDEALRVKILQAKRQELRLNGFDQEQVEKWYPDTWGMAGEHYPHLHPGTWTITKLAEVDDKGNEIYEPISHKDISWRATSEFEAKRNAQAYLADNPGEQLRVRQDTVSLPGSGITDRARLIDLTNKIKEATTTITRAGADPKEVLDDLYDQSAAKAYGPRRAAKRQFGPALQRETNLQGWTRDIEDFKDYLLAGERYTQLAPARQMLMKARNKIAELAGMPQVQKIGDFPSTIKYFSAAQYGNILARVDSAIEGLEGHPGAWDAGARYIASQLGYDPDIVSKLARPVQQVVALLKLGFQPARILSHGLQTGWAVYPVLGEKATLQGMAHSFNPKYADLIRDLAVTHSGNMSDIQGFREYAGAYFGRGSTPIDWTKGTAHILRDVGLLPFTMGIDYTRSVAAVGGYIQGLERGLDEPAARAYARDVMDRTTGIYNAADNPTLLRQLPGPVSQFKGFMLKTMQFMGNLRGAEIPRFAAFVSLMGVVGFPAIKALSNLIELGTGYNPENDLKRKFPVASRGAFGALGVDQPAAVGFADWFASRPGIPLAGLAGPAGSDILNFAKAGLEQTRGPSRQAEQDLDLALRQLSPEARRVWDEALRMATNSPSLIDPRTGSTIINSLTPLERIEALAGFTPLKVAKERESHEYIRNELEKAKDQRGWHVDKLAENQLELMRPGLTAQDKAGLIKDTIDLQKSAQKYGVAHNLVPAVRERIKEMMMERIERDLRKAPRAERPLIYQELQRYKAGNPQ